MEGHLAPVLSPRVLWRPRSVGTPRYIHCLLPTRYGPKSASHQCEAVGGQTVSVSGQFDVSDIIDSGGAVATGADSGEMNLSRRAAGDMTVSNRRAPTVFSGIILNILVSRAISDTADGANTGVFTSDGSYGEHP